MKKVAVFGNAGGGKSTLARQLSEISGLPLHSLDLVQFRQGRYWAGEENGGKIPHDEYLKIHAELLTQSQWIIDGYGCVASAWERFSAADTLVYIDLPVLTHYWRVTKRLIQGTYRNPTGWPEHSPVWSSTLDSYRVIWRCHGRLTPRYRQLVLDVSFSKRVYHLQSPAQMRAFLTAIKHEQRNW
ncbi:adenylate kinase [Bradyrhizobium rifense]|uniref:Adenylate kinase n=1 Tax=Bradyrhizobium rifense TaxID=515499 RepID=A0A5D3KUZ6_9BRAD|nr:adenylate kinase [Bradyrhizobium rifense]TYL96668.1 adenylate kinase [Bradyrhizobium rifense]